MAKAGEQRFSFTEGEPHAGSPFAVCCAGLVKRYGEVVALDGADLACPAGALTVIVGASGSGKTSLLRILGGLDRDFSGTALVDGLDVGSASEAALDELRRRSVGFVFQDYNLVPYLTVAENVALGLSAQGARTADARPTVRRALERVGLAEKAARLPRDLSGGECQRAAIARAVVKDPRVILADEPTGALDEKTAEEIARLLASLAEEGRTVVVVTHDVALFRPLARQMVEIRRGRTEVRLVRDAAEDEEAAAGPVLRAAEANSAGSTESAEIVSAAGSALGSAALPSGSAQGAPRRGGMGFRALARLVGRHLASCRKRCLVSAAVCAVGAVGLGVLFSLMAGMGSYSDDLQKRLLANTPVTATRDVSLTAADANADEGDGTVQGDGSLERFIADASLPEADAALPLLEGELWVFAAKHPDVLSVQGVYPLTNDLYARTGAGPWRFIDRWQLFEDVGV